VTKAKCWEYEEEVRTVVSRSKWAMTFEPHFLKQVIFGLKTPEADKLRVAEIAMRNNSHVRFSQARISRDKDFRMEFLEARMTRKLQHTA
jgi:hypothetical protein